MNAIFSAIIALNVLNLVSLILFMFLKFNFMRYLAHFSWILSVILIILFFLVGALFGLVGTLGMDLGGALNYLFSDANIKTLFAGKTSDMLNVCINEDGDIASKALGIGSGTNVGQISDLYTASTTIKTLQTNLTQNKNSITIPSINKQYDAYILDYRTTSTDSTTNGPATVDSAWKPFSDATQNKNGMAACTTNPSKDIWVPDKSLCPTGYTYISAGTSGTGSSSCLVINEWSSSVF
jgi:hypothetical protein